MTQRGGLKSRGAWAAGRNITAFFNHLPTEKQKADFAYGNACALLGIDLQPDGLTAA
jgi:predicted ABC-class ATPase